MFIRYIQVNALALFALGSSSRLHLQCKIRRAALYATYRDDVQKSLSHVRKYTYELFLNVLRTFSDIM